MPLPEGFSVAHFLTVADDDRSPRFYERVFGGRIPTRGNDIGAPAFVQIAKRVAQPLRRRGPTPDKPSLTLSVPADPNVVSSFMNIRVAHVQACYELWRSRGAEFITEPKDKPGRDLLLHARSRRPPYRGGAKQAGHYVRVGRA